MTEESDDQVWRPSGKSCTLPTDPKHVWKRLAELEALTWPTLSEQIERFALFSWLNPAESNEITDAVVFATACRISHVTQTSDEDALDALYAIASGVWDDITYLADGSELDSPRPPLSEGQDPGLWASLRLNQALDWFTVIVGELKNLLSRGVISQSDLARLLGPLRSHSIEEIFDSPASLGASIYRLPTPSTGFGSGHEMIHLLDALAGALHDAVDDMDRFSPGDKWFKSALMSLHLFWQLLVGYLWASVEQGLNAPLPGILASDPGTWTADVWEFAKSTLYRGCNALNAAAVNGKLPVGFSHHGGELSRAIRETPYEELIRRMDEHIERARRAQAPQDTR